MVRRFLHRRTAVGLLVPLLLLTMASGANATPAETTDPTGPDPVELNVTFTVQNTNRTDINCESDGKTYQIRGVLVAPPGALKNPQAVTLFLHGLGYGSFFANYERQPDYDFAAKQARAGHITVVVDRLGYGQSDRPIGSAICFGSHADMAHQMINQLRTGDYTVEGRRAPSFSEVVLAGHSVGGLITEATAYSFGNMDGIMVLSYSDKEVSKAVKKALKKSKKICKSSGVNPAEAPQEYVFLGQTQQGFINLHFFTRNAERPVVQTTANIRNRNPCGDILSYKEAVKTNLAKIEQIDVPALVLIGEEDDIYPIRAKEQAKLLSGTDDVTAVTLADTGHAVTLHRSADEFQAQVAQWLESEGFGTAPSGSVDAGGGGTNGVEAPWLFALGGAGLIGAAAAFLLLGRQHRRRSDS